MAEVMEWDGDGDGEEGELSNPNELEPARQARLLCSEQIDADDDCEMRWVGTAPPSRFVSDLSSLFFAGSSCPFPPVQSSFGWDFDHERTRTAAAPEILGWVPRRMNF